MVLNGDTDVDETRKRQLEDVDMKDEGRESKRSNFSGGSILKFLLPSASAGVIIGKSGETMQRLKKESDCRISMSKPNDYYPGTKERVILLQGETDKIMQVVSFVDSKQDEDFSTKIGDRSKQIKILIPNQTAGVIIGKGGDTIKQLKEEAGLSFLGVSSKDSGMSERIVTVQGDTSDIRLAGCRLVLDKASTDPSHGTIRNVNYLQENQRGAASNSSAGSGDGFKPGQPFNFGNMLSFRDRNTGPAPLMGQSTGGSMNSLRINLAGRGAAPSLELTTRLVDHVRRTLNPADFDMQAMRDITAAVGTLASYGLLSPDS